MPDLLLFVFVFYQIFLSKYYCFSIKDKHPHEIIPQIKVMIYIYSKMGFKLPLIKGDRNRVGVHNLPTMQLSMV